jgi:hypothetical protein
MKIFRKNKIGMVIFLSAFILFSHAGYGGELLQPTNANSFFEQYFDSASFARSTDPFEEMRHLRKMILQNISVPEKMKGIIITTLV